MDWLPKCRIKENVRAKRVILRVLSDASLLITVPKGFDRRLVTKILENNRFWIQECIEKVKSGPDNFEQMMPNKIHLAAVNETWAVRYRPDRSGSVDIYWNVKPRPLIELTGDFSNTHVCCRLLSHWLKSEAKVYLIPWAERVSKKIGLGYRKAQIRLQKTRLGSFSSRGTLSLNAAVLLLRPELVEYIIIHELCHGRYPDHSPMFWEYVSTFKSDFKILERELRHSYREFPDWLIFAVQ